MRARLVIPLLPFLASAPFAAGPAASPRFPVIAYYPSWGRMPVGQVPFEKLTHVNYAFAQPAAGGEVRVADTKLLSELAAAAHAKGVKVSAAVGGWKGGNMSEWQGVASRPAARADFAENLSKLCDAYRLDGIDIDWEYHDSSSAAHFALLIRDLGEKLHQKGRILSATVEAQGARRGAQVHPEVFGYVDFLNIRAYDGNWGARNQPHSTFGLADSALDYWVSRGCPRAKAVLGIPFYGRSYGAGDKTFARYRELVDLDDEAPGKDMVDGFHYNGLATVGRKADLALRKGGGIMIWEITQDTTGEISLLGAIDRAVRKPKPR